MFGFRDFFSVARLLDAECIVTSYYVACIMHTVCGFVSVVTLSSSSVFVKHIGLFVVC